MICDIETFIVEFRPCQMLRFEEFGGGTEPVGVGGAVGCYSGKVFGATVFGEALGVGFLRRAVFFGGLGGCFVVSGWAFGGGVAVGPGGFGLFGFGLEKVRRVSREREADVPAEPTFRSIS